MATEPAAKIICHALQTHSVRYDLFSHGMLSSVVALLACVDGLGYIQVIE